MENNHDFEITEEMSEKFEKIFIIVSGPVCSGKTTLTLNIARNIKNCFYLDKDDIVPTSNVAFEVVDQILPESEYVIRHVKKNKKTVIYRRKEIKEADRHCDFFKDFLRDPEYASVRNMIIKAIQFNNYVLVNAPYSSELKKEAEGKCEAFEELRYFFDKEGVKFIIIFVHVDKEELRNRLNTRVEEDSEAAKRDPNAYEKDADGKLRAKQSYLDGENVNPPLEDGTKTRNIDKFVVFKATTDKERDESYDKLMKELGIENYLPYDRNIHVNKPEEYENYKKKVAKAE